MPRKRPEDFETVFVEIGRLSCEQHFGASRLTINRWLEECGKERLIAERESYVRSLPNWGETNRRPIRACPPDFELTYVRLGPKACEHRYSAHTNTINRWLNERGADRLKAQRADFIGSGLTRKDVGAILAQAFPVKRQVSVTLARHAAQHLRIVRNGGFIISPAPNNRWRVGTKLLSAKELVQLAVSKGFDANLRAGAE
jgi:hypothetical protein